MPRLAPAGLTVVLLVAAAPAIAAQDHTVTATSNVFTEADITIPAGDRVLLRNAEGTHNFVFEDGPRYPQDPTASGNAVWATLSRTFDTAGEYRYYCAAHGGPGGSGMSGIIRVTGSTPAPSPSPSPQPTPSPSPSPGPGGGGTTPSGSAPAQLRSLSLAAKSFCIRCKRPGVRVRIDLTAPARVTGVLKRRAKRFGRVDFGTVAAGPRTLRFQRTSSGKRLIPGRYSLALSVDGAVAKTLRFRVRQRP
jgi:plastocyanin